jgi:hypothetical protein
MTLCWKKLFDASGASVGLFAVDYKLFPLFTF